MENKINTHEHVTLSQMKRFKKLQSKSKTDLTNDEIELTKEIEKKTEECETCKKKRTFFDETSSWPMFSDQSDW